MNDNKNRWQDNFQNSLVDSYCIYQLKDAPQFAKIRFMSSDYLRAHAIEPDFANYDAVYSGNLDCANSTSMMLENLYTRFNLDHPKDFTGRSVSVSDVIALRQNGVVSYYYVDSIGFAPMPHFAPDFRKEGFAHAEI